jgi:hypothetical protein
LVDDSRFKDLLRRAGDEDSVMQRTILVIMDAYRRGSPQTSQQRDKFDGFCLFWQVSGELGLALIGADSEVLSVACKSGACEPKPTAGPDGDVLVEGQSAPHESPKRSRDRPALSGLANLGLAQVKLPARMWLISLSNLSTFSCLGPWLHVAVDLMCYTTRLVHDCLFG